MEEKDDHLVINSEEAFEGIPKDRVAALRYVVTEPEAEWLVGLSLGEEDIDTMDFTSKNGDELEEKEIIGVMLMCETCLNSFCRVNDIDVNSISLEYNNFRTTVQAALDYFQKEGIQGTIKNINNENNTD